MSIQESRKVDFVGVSKRTVTLAIADHLNWEDTARHIALLREKIDAYLDFIESGELLSKLPPAKGCKFVIRVMAKYKPPVKAKAFLAEAKGIVEEAGGKLVLQVGTKKPAAGSTPENQTPTRRRKPHSA